MCTFRLLVLVVLASTVWAHPWPVNSKHATHRVRHVGRGLKLQTYHPRSVYETYAGGAEHPLSKRADAGWKESAMAFVQSKASVNATGLAYRSGFRNDLTAHAYVQQQWDGVPFANAVANVALKDNKVPHRRFPSPKFCVQKLTPDNR
jgi:extracellular elastinolytic metalloproteinase